VNLERVKTPSKTRRGRSRQNSEEKEIDQTEKTVVSTNLEAISEEKVNTEVKETEEKKTRRGGRTKKGIEIDLEKAKPAKKTTVKKSKKKIEILELDFDPIQMLEQVDSKEGKELKAIGKKLNVEINFAISRSSLGLIRKKIKNALKEQIEARDDVPDEDNEKDNSPEIVQKFINTTPSQTPSEQPPASTTPPSDASDVQEKETKKKKPRRATKDSTPSTPRRSSRIRQRSGSQSESGQSDAESEDGSKGNIDKPSQKVDPLPALEEDKEIVFSPPRSKQSSKSIPVSAENLQSSEPKFS